MFVDLALILLRWFVLLVKHIHNGLVDFQRISVDNYLAAAFNAKTEVLVLYVFLRAFQADQMLTEQHHGLMLIDIK